MEYGHPEKRRKSKDKRRERKKHPYRSGGSQRSSKVSLIGEKKEKKGKKK